MRIIHIIPDFSSYRMAENFGGLTRFINELSAAQVRAGHTVTCLVVTEAEQGSPCSKFEQLRTILDESPADSAIHGHDWYAASILALCFKRGLRNIIYTSHLPLRAGFTYKDYTTTQTTKLNSELLSLQLAKRIIAPSSFIKFFLVNEYNQDPSHITVIPNGVDLARFNVETPRNPITGPPKVLAAGRLHRQKGFDLAIRAMPFVRRYFSDVSLEIVGEGPEGPYLASLRKQLYLTSVVSLNGALHGVAWDAKLRAVNLLVVPSLFEPYGLVALEALASGTPVIAFTPSGTTEFLPCRWHCKTWSYKALGKAIVQMLSQESDNAEHVCRELAERFSWDLIGERYVNLYNEKKS